MPASLPLICPLRARTGTACLLAPIAVATLAMLALTALWPALAPLQGVQGAGAASIGDPTTATPRTHQLILFQGDDPETTAVEPTGLVQVLERTIWSVPWDESLLYTSVPTTARDVWLDNVEPFAHAGISVFGAGPWSALKNPEDPPQTGRVASGPYTGMYYWRFPANASRAVHDYVNPFMADSLGDYDPALTTAGAWDIGPASLGLRTGVGAANYTSPVGTHGRDILDINVTLAGQRLDRGLRVLVSADGGAAWTAVDIGTPANMTGPGASLRWRLEMSQDVAQNDTPVLTNLTIDVRYIPESNEAWLQLEYSMELVDGALDFTVSYPFDGSQTALIFLGYFDPHIELKVRGMEVTLTTVAGKVTYRHMSGDYDKDLALKVRTLDTSDGGSAMVWLGLGLVIIAALGGAYVWRRGRHPAGPGLDGDEGDEDEGGEEDEGGDGVEGGDGEAEGGADEDEADEGGPDEAEAGRGAGSDLDALSIEELRSMKEDILRAIKRADKELEDGTIGKEEHAAIRESYKGRAVRVMRAIEGKGR